MLAPTGRLRRRRCEGTSTLAPSACPCTIELPEEVRSAPTLVETLMTRATFRVAGACASGFVACVVAMAAVPLVLAYADGVTLLGCELPLPTGFSGLRAVQGWLQAAAFARLVAFPVGRYRDGPEIIAVPVPASVAGAPIALVSQHRLSASAAGKALLWCSLAALAGCPSLDAASRAVAGVCCFARPVSLLSSEIPQVTAGFGDFYFGRTKLMPLVPSYTLATSLVTPLAEALRAAWTGEALLREALLDASGPGSDDLHSWAPRILPLDLESLPPELLRALPDFSAGDLASLAFTPVYLPLTTTWLMREPPRPRRNAPVPLCPRTFMDLIGSPSKRMEVDQWMDLELNDLTIIAKDPGVGLRGRTRPPVLIVAQADLHDWARGDVWDCTLAADPCCVVQDSTPPISTHLNTTGLRTRLDRYPDRRLLSNLLEGVRLEADVELHAVFMPHLVSLPPGFIAVARELRRMRNVPGRWYEFYRSIPYFPSYLTGQGSQARKLEPSRHRRTTEAGAPHGAVHDSEGLRALSLNLASKLRHTPRHFIERAGQGNATARARYAEWLDSKGLPEAEGVPPLSFEVRARVSKFPHESKPTVGMFKGDLVVLRHAAQVLAEPLLSFTDDAKDFFNQLRLAPEELHKLGIAFLEEAGDFTDAEGKEAHAHRRLIFVSERVLGFGCHPASNIAQRFAEAVLFLLREDFDLEEARFLCEGCDPRPSFAHWRQARLGVHPRHQFYFDASGRRRLLPGSDQLRLYTAFIYTDDPVFAVVGIPRALRLLRCWRRLTDWLGLMMAIAAKRHLGTWIPWLGAIVCSQLGLIVIPAAKLLRAGEVLQDALAGGLHFDMYRSLVGLLEHIRGVFEDSRNTMFGLYEPHDPLTGAAAGGPATPVHPSVLMIKQLRAWASRLRDSGGISILERRRGQRRGAGATAVISSDAANDSTAAGLGGFCLGYYWAYTLGGEDARHTHITLLEFVAMCVSVIVFARCLGGFARIVILSDALATPYTLARGRPRSALLRSGLTRLCLTEEHRLIAERADTAHLSGKANIPSDLASRGRFDELHEVALQLGVKAKRLELDEHAIKFIRISLDEAIAASHNRVAGSRPYPPNSQPPPPLPSHVRDAPALPAAVKGRGRRSSACEDSDAVENMPLRFRTWNHRAGYLEALLEQNLSMRLEAAQEAFDRHQPAIQFVCAGDAISASDRTTLAWDSLDHAFLEITMRLMRWVNHAEDCRKRCSARLELLDGIASLITILAEAVQAAHANDIQAGPLVVRCWLEAKDCLGLVQTHVDDYNIHIMIYRYTPRFYDWDPRASVFECTLESYMCACLGASRAAFDRSRLNLVLRYIAGDTGSRPADPETTAWEGLYKIFNEAAMWLDHWMDHEEDGPERLGARRHLVHCFESLEILLVMTTLSARGGNPRVESRVLHCWSEASDEIGQARVYLGIYEESHADALEDTHLFEGNPPRSFRWGPYEDHLESTLEAHLSRLLTSSEETFHLHLPALDHVSINGVLCPNDLTTGYWDGFEQAFSVLAMRLEIWLELEDNGPERTETLRRITHRTNTLAKNLADGIRSAQVGHIQVEPNVVQCWNEAATLLLQAGEHIETYNSDLAWHQSIPPSPPPSPPPAERSATTLPSPPTCQEVYAVDCLREASADARRLATAARLRNLRLDGIRLMSQPGMTQLSPQRPQSPQEALCRPPTWLESLAAAKNPGALTKVCAKRTCAERSVAPEMAWLETLAGAKRERLPSCDKTLTVASRAPARERRDAPPPTQEETGAFRFAPAFPGGPIVFLPDRLRMRSQRGLNDASRHFAHQRAAALSNDKSEGAFHCPSELLESLCGASDEWVDYGINASTFEKDDLAWSHWLRFCEKVMCTDPYRTAAMMLADPGRETDLLGMFTLWIYPQLLPRASTRKWANPRSALAHARAVMRIFGRWGVRMPSAKALLARTHGLLRAYISVYGPHALTPTRKEPWLWHMTVDMANIPAGSLIGGRAWQPLGTLETSCLDMACVLYVTALRLAEATQHRSGEITYLVRDSLVWHLSAVADSVRDPSLADLDTARPGDSLEIIVPRSKSDQWGEVHCPFPIPIEFSRDPLSAFQRLLAIERREPCHGDARAQRPLIAQPDGRPYTHGILDPVLHMILVFLYGTQVARRYSWHSLRIGFACVLRAAGCPPDVIMLMCRWMSAKSLNLYSRKGLSEHVGWTARALLAKVDATQAATLAEDPALRCEAGDAYAQWATEGTAMEREEDLRERTAAQGATDASPTPTPRPPRAPHARARVAQVPTTPATPRVRVAVNLGAHNPYMDGSPRAQDVFDAQATELRGWSGRYPDVHVSALTLSSRLAAHHHRLHLGIQFYRPTPTPMPARDQTLNLAEASGVRSLWTETHNEGGFHVRGDARGGIGVFTQHARTLARPSAWGRENAGNTLTLAGVCFVCDEPGAHDTNSLVHVPTTTSNLWAGSLVGPISLMNASCAPCANIAFGSHSRRNGVIYVRAMLIKAIPAGQELLAYYPLAFADALCPLCGISLTTDVGVGSLLPSATVEPGWARYQPFGGRCREVHQETGTTRYATTSPLTPSSPSPQLLATQAPPAHPMSGKTLRMEVDAVSLRERMCDDRERELQRQERALSHAQIDFSYACDARERNISSPLEAQRLESHGLHLPMTQEPPSPPAQAPPPKPAPPPPQPEPPPPAQAPSPPLAWLLRSRTRGGSYHDPISLDH